MCFFFRQCDGLAIHVYTEQALNRIASLSSEVTPCGNMGLDAKGEYWYSAGMCLVDFKE